VARRGAQEGSVFRLADGRWCAQLDLGIIDGKRRRKSFFGKTRGEVARRLNEAISARARGLPVATNDRYTVGAYLERWLSDAVLPKVRPSTARRYEQIVRCHLVPAIGHIPLVRLAAPEVQAMLNAKAASGQSLRSVHHLRAVLRAALNQAVRWDLSGRNVATLVDPMPVPYREVRPLDSEQARALLAAAHGDRFEAIFVLALSTGARQGELLGLSWQDLDLATGTMTIRHALQRVGRGWSLVEPKTARSRRTLGLPPMAVAALREHRTRQVEDRLAAGSRWQDHDLVFTTTVGTPPDGTNVTHGLQRLLAAAGLPRQRFHDLRHACASLLLAQGVHPRVVMEQLGHSQIGLTMNTYSHVIPALQREAAAQIEALLG
jgi:integrase